MGMIKIKNILIFLFLLPALAHAEDWDNPTLTSTYTNVIADLKARDVTAAKMDYSTATDFPVGVIRWNASTKAFESWSGTAWADIHPEVLAHLASTANPHSVTAAQTGAATTSALSSHTSNTSNPHTVTADQIGALKVSNNLSDVANSTTARTNIAAAASADLSSHTSNTSNPHSVTAVQVGAMRGSQNLSECTDDTTARSNIGAASSGSNSDISTLSAVSTVSSNSNITLNATTLGSYITLSPGAASSSYDWKLLYTGKWQPPAAAWPDYTLWSGWPSCTSCARVRAIDPNAATDAKATAAANMLNTLVEDLTAQGFLQ